MNIPSQTETDGPDSMKCAHRRIISVLLEQPSHPERGYSEHWECASCGKCFAPVMIDAVAEARQLRLDNEQLKKDVQSLCAQIERITEQFQARIKELESGIRWRRLEQKPEPDPVPVPKKDYKALAEWARTIICNTSDADWLRQAPEWQKAAREFGDALHAGPVKPEPDACDAEFIAAYGTGRTHSNHELELWRTAWAKARETKKEAQ